MDHEKKRSFLGAGWSFPPEFLPESASVRLVSEEDDIRQSLYILLSTTPGERFMRPRYGCDLMGMVFERLSAATEGQLIDRITMAVVRYESRVILEEVTVHPDDQDYGRLFVNVAYTIRQTNTRDNIVFPFYLREGTNIEDS